MSISFLRCALKEKRPRTARHRGDGVKNLRGRSKPTPRRRTNARAKRALTQAEYEFECRLRNEDFQGELLQFLKDFPVFYRLDTRAFASFGKREPEVRNSWMRFFQLHEELLPQVKKCPSYLVFRFSPKRTGQVLELRRLEEEITGTMNDVARDFGAAPQPVISQIDPYKRSVLSVLAHALRLYNPEYFSLAGRAETDYAAREKQFEERWDIMPQWLQPFDRQVVLSMPPEVPLTQKSVGKLWRELHEGKQRPGRTDYATLLEIYDLMPEVQDYAEIGKRLGLEKDQRVKKLFRQVTKDIHGSKAKQFRKSRRHRGLSKVSDLGPIAETHTAPDSNSLHRISAETGIPYEKLEAAQSDPSVLTEEEKIRLRRYLRRKENT